MTENEAMEELRAFLQYDLTIMEEASIKTAIKALEKQIPKKPLRDYCLHCPRCEEEAYWNTEDGQQKFKYCHNCGQKLDWND